MSKFITFISSVEKIIRRQTCNTISTMNSIHFFDTENRKYIEKSEYFPRMYKDKIIEKTVYKNGNKTMIILEISEK